MKPNLTWQEVALLAVLLTAIIVSHGFFPAAVSAITSIASMLIGVYFVNPRKDTSTKGGAS